VPYRRTNRRFVARGAAALAAAALGVGALPRLLLEEEPGNSSPAPRVPERRLALTVARVVADPKGLALEAEGETDLSDGSVLALSVRAGERELARFPATVVGGRYRVVAQAAGEVVEGSYTLCARFELSTQDEAVRRALGYRPERLEARRSLLLPIQVAAAGSTRAELRALFEALNQGPPREPAVLDEIDRRAAAMAQRLWIAEQKAALHKLRLVVEEARRPELRRRDFDRLLLEAYLLAGL